MNFVAVGVIETGIGSATGIKTSEETGKNEKIDIDQGQGRDQETEEIVGADLVHVLVLEIKTETPNQE